MTGYHDISASEEHCSLCGAQASHKVAEDAPDPDGLTFGCRRPPGHDDAHQGYGREDHRLIWWPPVRSAGGGDQPDTEWVPWHDAIGRQLVSGDLIAQVRRLAAVQHPGPYALYVEMWSQNHECWCRPILNDDGRVEVMRQPECAKCGDDATAPCECTPDVGDDIDQPDTPCPQAQP